jgi:hypothetical protein
MCRAPLFAVALSGGWVPARRPSCVQPMQALRRESSKKGAKGSGNVVRGFSLINEKEAKRISLDAQSPNHLK